MKDSRLLAALIFICMLALQVSCIADSDKHAVVRVKSQEEGTGFIVSISSSRDEVYVLTAEHLVGKDKSAHIVFYGHPDEVLCEVVKRGEAPAADSRGMAGANVASQTDLAVLVVRDKRAIPADITQVALAPENHPVLHVHGGESADIIGFPVLGLPWSVIRVTLEGEDKEKGLLDFQASLGQGVSGGPVIIGDYVVGMAVIGGSNAGSPGKAISLSPIRHFLEGTVPLESTNTTEHYKPAPERTEVDPAAKSCALDFLALLGQNKLREAYSMYADETKHVFSQAQFIANYNQYVISAVSGVVERRLTGIQEFPGVPGTGTAMVGDTYVLTFETKFRAAPSWTVFEIVTVFREAGSWTIATFSGNSLQDSATDSSVRPSDTKSGTDKDNTPEHVSSLALDLLHTNRIDVLYNDFISDLQKQTGLRDLASCVAAFSGTIQMWPGLPLSRELLMSRDMNRVPGYFSDLERQFHYIVYLSKYPQGQINEGVYLVFEKSAWKIAAFDFHEAY